jgi:hypothetical protein
MATEFNKNKKVRIVSIGTGITIADKIDPDNIT